MPRALPWSVTILEVLRVFPIPRRRQEGRLGREERKNQEELTGPAHTVQFIPPSELANLSDPPIP